MTLCKWLRWKGWYAEWDVAELAAMFAANEVPYTCLRTVQAWGPDDGPCAPERCGPHRPCFQPSPRLPSRVS